MPAAGFTTSLRTTLQITDHPLGDDRTPMTGTAQQVIDDVRRYQEAGIDHMAVGPRSDNFN